MIVLIIIIIVSSIIYYKRKIKAERNKISFKESLDLAEIPVITLNNNNTKLNFVLDTGSSNSHISKAGSKKLTEMPVDTNYTYSTATGEDNVNKMVETTLKYKNKEFKTTLYINYSLDSTFKTVKKNCGIILHGILGSDFLSKNKYILDFAEYAAYQKK